MTIGREGYGSDSARSLFVGRERELEGLAAALGRARAGRGGLVLVSGPPGIGKTRTVEEFLALQGLPPDRVLWGRCPDRSDSPPFWPWRRPLRTCAAWLDDAALRALSNGVERPLVELIPAARGRLGRPADAGEPEPAGEDRLMLIAALAELLIGAAAVGPSAEPVVIVLDDLHWADSGSLDLLAYVAPELASSPLLVVATHRDAEMRRAPEIAARLARVSERLALGGLAAGEVAAFLRATTRVEPSRELVATLARTTAGNPFFLAEMVRVVGSPDALEAGASPPELPDSVRDVIRRHLEPLPPPGRELLSLAAVIGLEFDLSTLENASGQPALALLEGLADAARLGVIAEVRDEAQRWRFAHALIPETLYADLPPSQRAQGHRQVAEALERVHAGAPEPPATELAHHWFRAVPLGGAARALDWSERAARAAYAALAWDEAARHARRALQALSACPPDERRRLELLLLLGAAEGCAAHIEPAREAYEEGIRLAESLDRPEDLARAALEHGRLEIGMVPNPRVVELLERAARALPPEPSRLRCAVTAELANALIFSDESERREKLARDAVAMARAFGDPSALVATLLADHFVRWGPDGDPRAMLAMMEEAIALLPQVADRRLHLEIRRWRMRDLLELGERAAAEQEADRIGRLVGEWRLQSTAVYARLARGGIALLAGRLDEAARAADVELEPFLSDPFSTIRNSIEGLRLAVRLERDELETYRAAGDQLDALARAVPMWRGPLAVVFDELGDAGRSRVLLDHAEASGFADLRRDGTWFTSIGMFALVAPRLRSRRACARLYELLRPHAGRHVVYGVAIGGQGSLERHLGGLAEALGELEVAVAHLERALSANESAALRLPTAFTRLALARALARRAKPGDAARAVELRDEARREAESLGLRRLLRHVAQAEAEGLFERVPRAATASAKAEAGAALVTGSAVLRQSGDTWLVARGEHSFHLKDAKGLAYLARLLAEPGRELHVLDLVGGASAVATSGDSVAADAGLSAGAGGDAGELLDAQARGAYRERLDDLREELAEAERFGDGARAAHAREEIDFLAQELARATGLGGRARRAGSAAERARVNATRAIGAVLRKIAAADPVLGEHLTASVRTGLFCSYQPGVGRDLRWEL